MNQSRLLIVNTPEFHTHSGKQPENRGKNLKIEAYQEEVQGTCILAAIFCFII